MDTVIPFLRDEHLGSGLSFVGCLYGFSKCLLTTYYMLIIGNEEQMGQMAYLFGHLPCIIYNQTSPLFSSGLMLFTHILPGYASKLKDYLLMITQFPMQLGIGVRQTSKGEITCHRTLFS
jgi:hypothetical protein